MPVSLRGVGAVGAVALVALALTANLGFYTLPGMLAVLVAAALVVGVCLTGERLVNFAPKWAMVAMYGPALATVGYLVWLTVHETSALKVQFEAPLAAVGALVVLLAYLGKVRAKDALQGLLIGVGVLLTGATVLVPQLRFGGGGGLATALGMLACTILMYLVWLSFLASPRGTAGPDAAPVTLAPHAAPPGEGGQAAGPDAAPVRLAPHAAPPGNSRGRGGGRGKCLARGWWVRWGMLLVAGTVIRGLAVVGSPEPVIDVHAWLTQAPQMLLRGANPYAGRYDSPYGTERAARAGIHDAPDPRPPAYPPLAILTGLPAVLLGVDVRWVNVAAEVLAAVLLLLAGMRRGNCELGLLCSGLYLCLPRAAFVIEQAWFEPQLAALLGLALVAAPRRAWLAGVALGGFMAGKQYALALLPSLVMALRRDRKVLWIGLGTAAAAILPFLLWSPADFWQIVVTGHLHRPVVYHALTLAALLKNEMGVTVPAVALWGLAAVLLGLLAWRTPPHEERGAGLWLAAALLVFCLCHTQGFPNYYYLALFLLLMGVAQEGAKGEDRREATRPEAGTDAGGPRDGRDGEDRH